MFRQRARLVLAVLAIAACIINIGPTASAARGIPNTFASAVAIDKANQTITLPSSVVRYEEPGRFSLS